MSWQRALQAVPWPCCLPPLGRRPLPPSPLLPAAVQGKGLGRFLMQLLELVGRKSGVARLMLTVFHQSAAAVALYRKLG